MGYYEESCLLCGLPCSNPLEKIKYSWLDDCIGINEFGKIELVKYNGAGEFDTEHFETYHNNTIYQLHKWGYMRNYNKLPRGVVCHEKCYILLKTKLNYKINFHDIWPMYSQLENEKYTQYNIINFQSCDNDLKFLNYYPQYYHSEQYLDTDKLLRDGYEWMLLDPTSNEKNAERIINIWKPIIINFQFSNININNHELE